MSHRLPINERRDRVKIFGQEGSPYFMERRNELNQRLKSIEIRKDQTDEWKSGGLKEGFMFVTLTDIIYKTWADKITVL